MRVFAIDPGNRQSAYCIMDGDYKLREFNKAPNGIVAEILRTFLKGRKDGDRRSMLVFAGRLRRSSCS